MRVFNGRYFLFAAALFVVFLLVRSRAAQPEPDVSWTQIAAADVENVGSSSDADPLAICQQETACIDKLDPDANSIGQIEN